MFGERQWGRVNAGLNVLVIALLGIVVQQLRADRVEREQLRVELKNLNERLNKHLSQAHINEFAPHTAGGQDGL